MSVHNLKTERIQPGDAYVGRRMRGLELPAGVFGHDGFFGNPFRVTKARTREQAISSFEVHARERLATDTTFRDGVRALYGRRLFCWCSSPDNPQPCHADVLERLACELAEAERMVSEGGPG